ncbi:lipocalin family protein [Aggregatimonas sangjinii]|uniref:Lipocalin family protein n=1 Tax=Aggregatimonas sangjinii TaxID=2583587 RepID=A0A5B7ST26_9FLAO|nr:lipocalin family protein [Aggregatimonas sangjinii]QCX01342.1 lipocalin family protein [Aggregatimonas sangjinii]
MAKGKRAITKAETETILLTSSSRKCCLCYGIDNDFREKYGQIAHIDGDRTNSSLNNLAWLCLVHHDKFDGKTSQSKGYTIKELRSYRDKLYLEVSAKREKSPNPLYIGRGGNIEVGQIRLFKDIPPLPENEIGLYQLLLGKWKYITRTVNRSIVKVIHSGDGCPDFKPDYIEFTTNKRYIQFAFLDCQEELNTHFLYKLEGKKIMVSYEDTNEAAFDSEIIYINAKTLILRTRSGDIVLEEGFSKIDD